MQNVVRAVHGLNDFRLKSRSVQPRYNSTNGSAHYLAPDDVATIYNVRSLYNTGIDATGHKLVVVGQTQINLSDIQQFRSYFNLPAKDPQVILVPGTRDPGIRRGDMEEADLDLEWAGAIASQPWKEAYVFFKHEDSGTGPKLARRFEEIFHAG
jgi:subtilase family serine protease